MDTATRMTRAQVNRFKEIILLIVRDKYLKSCSRRFYCPDPPRLCGTMFITQPSCLFDFHSTESVRRKWFVLAVYQFWKGISAGPALKHFTWFIGAGGLHFCHFPAVCIEKTEIRRFYREDWDPGLCTSWYLRVENCCAAAIFKKTCFARRKIGIWHEREPLCNAKFWFCFHVTVAGKTRECSSQVDSKLGPKMHLSAKS